MIGRAACTACGRPVAPVLHTAAPAWAHDYAAGHLARVR